MSLTPSVYSDNGKINQWLNLIWNSHDLICGCNSAFNHLAEVLKKKGQQPCLPSTEDSTTQTGEGDGDGDGEEIEPGDLERLFSEEFDEDEG